MQEELACPHLRCSCCPLKAGRCSSLFGSSLGVSDGWWTGVRPILTKLSDGQTAVTLMKFTAAVSWQLFVTNRSCWQPR